MNVYVYQAALLCEDCGVKARLELTAAAKAPADPDDEGSYDSDDFPKGPYPGGGGEADSPQHCDSGTECVNALVCRHGTHELGAFLENDLTAEGLVALADTIREDEHRHDDGGC